MMPAVHTWAIYGCHGTFLTGMGVEDVSNTRLERRVSSSVDTVICTHFPGCPSEFSKPPVSSEYMISFVGFSGKDNKVQDESQTTISISKNCHKLSCLPMDPTRYRFSPRWSADMPDLSSLLWTIQFKWPVSGDPFQLEITRGPRDRKRVRVCSLPRSLLDSLGTSTVRVAIVGRPHGIEWAVAPFAHNLLTVH
jgi:hypothetical protein